MDPYLKWKSFESENKTTQSLSNKLLHVCTVHDSVFLAFSFSICFLLWFPHRCCHFLSFFSLFHLSCVLVQRVLPALFFFLRMANNMNSIYLSVIVGSWRSLSELSRRMRFCLTLKYLFYFTAGILWKMNCTRCCIACRTCNMDFSFACFVLFHTLQHHSTQYTHTVRYIRWVCFFFV